MRARSKRQFALVSAAALLVMLAVLYVLSPWKMGQSEVRYDDRRTVQYSFTVKNDQGAPLPQGLLRTYAPVQQTSHQSLDRITASHDYHVVRDALGNTVLEFPLADMAPYESRIISVRADLSVAHSSQPLQAPKAEAYLAAEPFVEIDHPRMERLAGRFAGEPMEAANAAFRWVGGYLQSETYIEDDRGALWALDNRRGDCTEFMYLFLAAARLHGIPARGVGGYVIESAQVVRPAAYHNWAEVYINGAWHVVDPQRGVFMAQQGNYIAMRIVQSPEGSLLGRAHRYTYEGAGLVVKMN